MKNKLALSAFFVLLFIACVENTTKQEETILNNIEITEGIESESVELDYMNLGISITSEIQGVLSQNLVRAIQDSGVVHALQFCSLQAYPLIDSIAKEYGVAIKRVSHKARNPQNKANTEEMAKIDYYMKMKEIGAVAKSSVNNFNGVRTYYSPIMITMPTCLKCHGVPGSDIHVEDYIILNSLYPDDEATDFKMGDLRGMWRIDFPKDFEL